MKAIITLAATMLFSMNATAMAVKFYKGQDDHGKECGLMLGFEEGKIVSIMVQALADEVGKKKPVKIWEMMMPEHFEKLIKQSGTFKSGKMYFQAKETMNMDKIKLERNMGLAIDLKRGTLNYEKHNKMPKESVLMSCVGLKESKDDMPTDAGESDPCDIEENAAMRNMCKVEAGKKKGTIPEGAVASPVPAEGKH